MGDYINQKGQSLVEVLVGITVGTIMIAAAVGALVPALTVSTQANRNQVAAGLGKEFLENVRVIGETDWNTLYSLSRGSSTVYSVIASSTPPDFAVVEGDLREKFSGIEYLRYFYVENTCRDNFSGQIEGVEPAGGACDFGSSEDPSTQKVTVVYGTTDNPTRFISQYFTRYRNRVTGQTNWFGGPGDTATSSLFSSTFATSTNVNYTSTTGSLYLGPDIGETEEGIPPFTNISSSTLEHWAWNDLVGWIDFYITGTVHVLSDNMDGYASSSADEVSFDCATTNKGPYPTDICSTSNYQVTNNRAGNLAGWAWNDTYGWISFNCSNHDFDPIKCSSINYSVYIDGSGDFHGYAWNDIIGWISFHCADKSACDFINPTPISYKVRTLWRPVAASGTLDSVTFDTGATSTINSLVWDGDLPIDTNVGFQIAGSHCGNGATDPPLCTVGIGAWDFIGGDGTNSSFYDGDSQGDSVTLNASHHSGYRYFRYRVRLLTNAGQTATPRIDSIILNWSP